MLSKQLLEQIKSLDEAEKQELVELLIQDLKLVSSAYEIYTPFGNEAAAQAMLEMLETDKTENQLAIK